MRGAFLLVLLGVLSSASASAATRSISRSVWVIERDQVTVRIVMPAAEAGLLTVGGAPALSNEKLAAYELQHVSVESSGGACAAVDQGYDIGRINTLAVGPSLRGFEIIFHCQSSAFPVLKNSLLFEQMPQHVDYARIEVGGKSISQLFTARQQQFDLGVSTAAAGAGAYAGLGANHVARSLERVGFLLGILLLAPTLRQWLTAASGLLLGYALASAIPELGVVPRTGVAESVLAFLVVQCALLWRAKQVSRPGRSALVVATVFAILGLASVRLSAETASLLLAMGIFSASFMLLAARHRESSFWALPTIFAILDGTVPWSDYSQLNLWGELGPWSMLCFNVGSLVVEWGIMLLLYGVAAGWTAARKRGQLPHLVGDIAAATLAGMGAFWVLIQLKS